MLSHRKCVICLGIGAFLAILGLVFYLCFPVIFNFLLKKEISLKNGTLGYNVWQDIPLPIYQKLYFFNITNSDDFMRKKAKPNLVEVGPYTFVSKWLKEDIVWHPNHTVSFREVKTFVFLRNESIGSQDDKIVTVNAPLLLAANFLKTYDLPIRLAASLAFNVAGERLIIKKSIKQLAFDGYRDIIVLLSPLLKRDIPFKTGLFAWLYGRNDTDDGQYTVFTGEDDLTKLNMINRWNGKETLGFWKGKTCNMINGSNAELSPPVRIYDNTFTFFQSIFCRSITLDYVGDTEYLGVSSRRFMANNRTFANASVNPDNACFATKMKLASGVQDISACQYDAPVALSFPHFYLADKSYLDAVKGLRPNSSLHSLHIDVEPLTGFSIGSAVRFQINLKIERILGISQLQNVPTVMFPVFWAEILFSLDDDFANIFKSQMYLPRTIAFSLIFSFIGIGCAMWLAMMCVMFYNKKRNRESSSGPSEKTPLLN